MAISNLSFSTTVAGRLTLLPRSITRRSRKLPEKETGELMFQEEDAALYVRHTLREFSEKKKKR